MRCSSSLDDLLIESCSLCWSTQTSGFFLRSVTRRVRRAGRAHERLRCAVERVTGSHALRSCRASFDVFRGEFKSDEIAAQLLRDGQRGRAAGKGVDHQIALV